MARISLHLGKVLDTNQALTIEADRSRAIFICGKRGSGKSYTMGVLLEELFEEGRGQVLIVVADPMGIFHTLALPNTDEVSELYAWGLTERRFPVRLLVPGDPRSRYGGDEIVSLLRDRGVDVRPLQLDPSALSPDTWCSLFDLSINDLMGIALYRAVSELGEQNRHYTLSDIERAVRRDTRAQDKTKEALLNRLSIARKWGIFREEDVSRTGDELFTTEAINVVDLSVVDPGPHGLRALIVDMLARHLFGQRTRARRQEEFGLPVELPRVWLALDEAHQFVPSSGTAICKDMLIRWVKEGRQPGLGLIAATQQPAAMDAELLSQCDLIIAHKITSLEDINSLNKLSATYMSGELRALLRNLSRRGEALVVDDEKESVMHAIVRPRRSRHGGGESVERVIRDTLF